MNFIGAILNHPALIEFFAEIVVKKCEVKPDEDIYIYIYIYIYIGIHIKSNCQDIYSNMLIFQSQGCCSEVLSVCNNSEEIFTKR